MFDPAPHIYPCGDHALTVAFGDKIDPAINRKVITVFNHLQTHKPAGIKDLIPAYHTLTIVYDVLFFKKKDPSASAYENTCAYIEKIIEQATQKNTVSRNIDIPVCYDIPLAPDLASLAATHSLSVEEVIRLHSSQAYRVYMIGFLPGFAYMGSVDEKIRTPRKPIPRISVPAGSVGIAGEQTGIYPFDSPGGWQLIGQTPVKIFEAKNEMPCYLQPGDEVRFYPVTFSEFTKLKKA